MTLTAKSSLTSPVDDVLQDYLNDLLVTATELSVASQSDQTIMAEKNLTPVQRTVDTSIMAKPVALREPMPSILPADIPVATEPVSPAVTMTEPAATTIAPPVIVEPELAEPEIAVLSETELDAMASEQARINWQASAGVECLIFKVAGLKLALPLPMLGGVFNANDDVTPLFGQAKWSLGVWQSETDTLTIVDSARLIMPERGALLADQGYRYIIQLDRSPWALACQEICDTMTLKHDSIKWRGEGSKRPWLAGTVISEMCALIDVSGMLRMLEQHRRVKR
ncbi:MAG: chemotaxis protein CheW [Bacterioplanes sp.]|nr:chemotaxis protein CheW [Bacterioplanes sp.]